MRLLTILVAQVVSALAFTAATWSPFSLLDEGNQVPMRFAGSFGYNNESRTIYSMLKHDERFTRLTKAIDFVDGVAERLDDDDMELTFFAPPDEALRGPHENDTKPLWPPVEELPDSMPNIDLSDAIVLLEDFQAAGEFDDGRKPDKEKCKKILKIVLRALLEYHIIPTGAFDVHKLGTNQTFITNLTIPGTMDSYAQRIRVQQKVLPPSTYINFYSKVTYGGLKASNGIVHIVNHPLVPPPSIFEGLYLLPHFFSTFTSALQRSDLTHEVDLRWKHKEGWKGSDSVTVFAPTNHAFDLLPQKLQLFLFSPYGARTLKKLVQYHVVPDTILYSDFVHFSDRDSDDGDGVPSHRSLRVESVHEKETLPRFRLPSFGQLLRGEPIQFMKGAFSTLDLISNETYKLDTLLTNHTVEAQILKEKIAYPFPGPKKPARYQTKVLVNDHHVLLADVPARNGAVHVVPRLLNPCRAHHKHFDKPHKLHHPHPPRLPCDHHKSHHPHGPHYVVSSDDDDWERWELWLPQWAEGSDIKAICG